MPNVASELTVQRSLRPEPSAGRAATQKAARTDSFDKMLDTQPETPRAERDDRPQTARRDESRTERPERIDTPAADRPARANSRKDTNTDSRAERPSSAKNGNSTKSADSTVTRQAKDGPSDTSEQQAAVSAEDAATAAVAEAEATAQAGAVAVEGEAPVEETTTEETATDEGADTETEASAEGTDKAKTDAAVAAAIPVAPQPVEQKKVSTDADIAIDPAAIAAVSGGEAEKVETRPEAKPTAPANAPVADAKPETKNTDAAPAEKPVANPALAAAGTKEPKDALKEGADTKKAAHAEKKAEGTKLHAEARTAAQSENAATPKDAAPAEQTKAPAQQPVEHENRHAALAAATANTEARAETAATQTTVQPVAANPVVPLALATTSTLSTMFPVVAVKAEAIAQAAVPISGLAVEIVSQAKEGSKRFEIRLDPPELGRVEVRLDVDTAGKVTSRLVVDRTETLDLLRRDAHQLERALQQAGLDTGGGLEFSLRDQSFNNRDQGQRDSAPTSRLIVPDDETAAADAARRGYGRMIGRASGVDIRV